MQVKVTMACSDRTHTSTIDLHGSINRPGSDVATQARTLQAALRAACSALRASRIAQRSAAPSSSLLADSLPYEKSELLSLATARQSSSALSASCRCQQPAACALTAWLCCDCMTLVARPGLLGRESGKDTLGLAK
jgi:hypothetical protein